MDGDNLEGPALSPGFQESSSSHIEPSHPRRKHSSATKTSASRTRSSSESSGTDDSDSDSDDSSSASESDSKDKQAQPHLIGPVLPQNLERRKDSEICSSDDDDKQRGGTCPIGPALPPGVNNDELESKSIGPVLPPGFLPTTSRSHHEDDDDGGFGIGPLPPTADAEAERVAYEQRAAMMRHREARKEAESSVPHRESWMTELPSVGLAKNMGLQARKLGSGSKVKDQDRSAWTDTPADRARKLQDLAEGRGVKRSHEEAEPHVSARDQMLSEQVSKYNKHARAESLLDLHQKKMKKDKKKEEKRKKKEKKKKEKKKSSKDKKRHSSPPAKPERRPFSREEDLNTNRFDSAQRKSLIKRSQQLNSRFSSGKQNFL